MAAWESAKAAQRRTSGRCFRGAAALTARKSFSPRYLREGCAPGGPGRRRACSPAEVQHEGVARRWPGAVGNSRIVAYGARSPLWRLGAKHAQTLSLAVVVRRRSALRPPAGVVQATIDLVRRADQGQ